MSRMTTRTRSGSVRTSGSSVRTNTTSTPTRRTTGTTPTSGGGNTIDSYKAAYDKAKAAGDRVGMDAAHAGAEKIRASQGYSGGVDGSQRIQTGTGSSYTPKTATSQNGSSYTPLSDYNDQGLDSNSMAQINQYKAQYDQYKAQGRMDLAEQAHQNAEALRAQAGYSGGVDGSGYQITRRDILPQEQEVERIKNLGDTVNSINDLREEASKYGAEGQAMLAAQLDQTLKMINSLESQITGQIQSQMGGNDPGLQSAIALVKDEVTRQRDDTLEELNSRGLVQSGVYAEMLDRINKNELTQVQQLVGSRTSDLQNQLNSAIMSVAQMRLGALTNNQNASMGLFQSTANNMSQLGIAGVNASLQQRGQDLQNQQYYAGLNQNQSQFDKTYQQNTNQFGEQMKFNYANLSQDAQLTREGFANSRATSGAGNALGWAQLGYQKEQDSLARQDALDYNKQQTLLYNQELTGQQIQSMQNSGSLDTVVKQINSGQMTKADAAALLTKQGLTPQAQQYALTYIGQNAQDKVRQPGGTGYMPNSNNPRYTYGH